MMPLTLHSMLQLGNIETQAVQCSTLVHDLACSHRPIQILRISHLHQSATIQISMARQHLKYSAEERIAAVVWHRFRSKSSVTSIITYPMINHLASKLNRMQADFSVNQQIACPIMSMSQLTPRAKSAALSQLTEVQQSILRHHMLVPEMLNHSVAAQASSSHQVERALMIT